MKGKKTVGVVDMIEYANMQLARTDDFADRTFKCGISIMIETILHKSNNYNGFNFLNTNATQEQTNCDGSEFYNRYYHLSHQLRK